MSKYDSLARHLKGCQESSVTMTFEEVDRIVDGGLPSSAYDHRPWWSNRYDGKDAQNLGWQSAGWETRDVDMSSRKVTFVKVTTIKPEVQVAPATRPLTIDEAKRGLATAFGVSPEAISITINA